MARKSPEARAAAHYLAGAMSPSPPQDLPPKAQALWLDITTCRPADYFKPGSLTLLRSFCELAVIQEQNLAQMAKFPTDLALQKASRDMANAICQLATKLRLTIQTEVDRKSGKLDEHEPSGTKSVTRWAAGDISPRVKAN